MNDLDLSPFFFVGGALPVDAPSYIPRQADDSLLTSLKRGEFCYVLVSRQMGKSSLMLKTAARLREEGDRVVILDLNAIGHVLDAQQWYYSLLMQIARRLNLREELRAFWEQEKDLSPLLRWTGALQFILLKQPSERLLLFFDEIDQVRLLPFSTDEFFAAIRSCFSRRAEDPEFARLTVCLMGVVLPSDLINDPRMTPFNIARHIELTDFDEAQVLGWETGLGREEILGQALLERVFYWTNGHPYLTQRLCREIAESPEISTPQHVDALCEALYLSSDAQEQDDNLVFVRDRLLKSDAEIASLLLLYERIYRGHTVRDDKANRLVNILHLSGIVKSNQGRLQVRNRIYSKVFDTAWIASHMPDAEQRRRRAAVRRARLQVGAVALALAVLAVFGFVQAWTARQAESNARRAERSATALTIERNREARGARAQAYLANMQLIQREYEDANYPHVVELLDAMSTSDARGVEWDYWHRLMNLQSATLQGHRVCVLSARFSPNGRQIVTASDDKTARIWDASTGREIAAFHGPTGVFLSADFSPDGNKIVTTGSDRTARIWDVASGHVDRVLRGHDSDVYSAAFSPDGRKIITTASVDATARIWDTASGHLDTVLRGHKGPVVSAVFSPDGNRIVTASHDRSARIWDAANGREILSLTGHSSGVYSAAYSPDGRRIVTASDDRTARVWDASTGKQIVALGGHTEMVMWATFSPNGRLVATTSKDAIIRIWDWTTPHLIATLQGHTDCVRSVAFSPNGRSLVSASDDGTARVWSIVPREGVTLGGHEGRLYSANFSPDGTKIITAGSDKTARIWNASNGQMTTTLKGHTDQIKYAIFSPNGRTIVTASSDKTARIWDAATGQEAGILKGHTDKIRSAAFSPDGSKIVTASDDKTARIWDAATGQEILSLKGHSSGVYSAAYSPDGRRIVTASVDNTARIWDGMTGRKMLVLHGHTEGLYSARFSSNGRRIVTASDDHTVRIWDAMTGKETAVLKGHRDAVINAVFSPDDSRIVTASGDRTARIWDTASGQEVVALKGHRDAVISAVFSPDGKQLVTASVDGTARIWFLGPDKFDWDTLEGQKAQREKTIPQVSDNIGYAN